MKIEFSEKKRGTVGIGGHVGVGHIHSHSGFVQDDSAGFAVAVDFLREALPIDLHIAQVHADITTNVVEVVLECGGRASASPARGITPAEKEIMEQRAPGLDAAYTQAAAVQVFGRLYGQGASELPVCFQGACALAVLDGFYRAAPERFYRMEKCREGMLDAALTTVLDIDGMATALLLLVNFTEGGIGPDEDYEGNTNWDVKGKIMEPVGLLEVPTVIVESKAFIPALKDGISGEYEYMVRAQTDVDNVKMAECLLEAGRADGYPIRLEKNMMPMAAGSLEKATAAFGEQVAQLGQELARTDDCLEKVRLVAQLAKLISEDAGGISFMGNTVNDKARGAGIMPGKNLVISMIVSEEYKNYMKIPQVTPADVDGYKKIITDGLKKYCEQEM